MSYGTSWVTWWVKIDKLLFVAWLRVGTKGRLVVMASDSGRYQPLRTGISARAIGRIEGRFIERSWNVHACSSMVKIAPSSVGSVWNILAGFSWNTFGAHHGLIFVWFMQD